MLRYRMAVITSHNTHISLAQLLIGESDGREQGLILFAQGGGSKRRLNLTV